MISDLTDFILFSSALKNIDSYTRRDFENKLASDNIPRYEQLIEFVTQHVRTFEFSDNMDNSHTMITRSKSSSMSKPQMLLVNSQSGSKNDNFSQPFNVPGCLECKGSHLLCRCENFIK